MPLTRRIPKRGFTNIFRKPWAIVNLRDLNRFAADSVVDAETLKEAGLVKSQAQRIKLLAQGEVTVALTVKVQAVSAQARSPHRSRRRPGGGRLSGPAFSSIAKIPELKQRILFTLLMLAVYRLGCQIPTPGIDPDALMAFFARQRGTIFGLFDMFSGGALERLSVFALGIMPYISAAIIMELLKVVIPGLEKLYKEGEAGPEKDQAVHPLRHAWSSRPSRAWGSRWAWSP